MTSRGNRGGFSDWGQVRDYAIEQFGETPHPATEADVIAAFELHPDQVIEAVMSVMADVAAGTVRSGWGVLRTRATRISTPVSNPTRNTSLEREKAVSRAEQWMHAAGMHFDDQHELEDELFGDFGRLRHHDDPQLRHRMVALWREVRPTGERLEADMLERANTWKRQRSAAGSVRAAESGDTGAEPLTPAAAAATTEHDPMPL